MMAEMLSFLDSKSTAYVLEDSGSKAYPGKVILYLAPLPYYLLYKNLHLFSFSLKKYPL